ncbi:hypothetical protein pb186bvf_012908 [Paramecium bursaria]
MSSDELSNYEALIKTTERLQRIYTFQMLVEIEQIDIIKLEQGSYTYYLE